MRYQKILLINPSSKSELGGSRPPAGLGYIAQILAENGIEYKVLDMRLGYKIKDVQRLIKSFNPDLVGLSLYTHGYKYSYEFISKLRAMEGNFDIVVGGPHVSTIRKDVLHQCHEIDYGIVLEGERTIIELCKGDEVREIKGLLYRENGEVIYTGDREFIRELDDIPYPTYNGFEIKKYIPERFIVSTRGCPHQCIYCPVKPAIGTKMRFRSAKNVIAEIKYWYDRGYRQFNFVDDNFTIKKKRIYEICDEIEKQQFKGLFLRCTNGVRADTVDREILARMREVGFKSIAFGVEGGNNKILKVLKKGENIEVIEKAIKIACDLDYDVALFFLVGSPTETWADIHDSVALAKRYPILRVNFYNLIPYPCTELFEWIKDNNCFVRDPEDYLNEIDSYDLYPAFETSELPREERIKALKYLKSIEKEITVKATAKRLAKYRFAGKLAAHIFALRPVQKFLFQNNTFRNIMEKIRYKMYFPKS